MKTKARKSGFTLVELMVVAIIVAILAAVAIPLMSANKKRAMMTEAEAGLGMLRSSMRTLLVETGAYNKDRNGGTIADSTDIRVIPGVQTNDLAGRWFDGTAYSITFQNGGSNYLLQCQGNAPNNAPQKADVVGMVVTLSDDGTFTRTGY